jgi:predicted transcriptional regulator
LTYELSIENYDWVEGAFPEIADRCHSPHLLLQMQDALRIICEYACFRRHKMKIGSVLILRFFHGYHTSEIAQIMRVTPSAVSHQLKLAQTEVCQYLNDPTQFNFYCDISDARSGNGLNYGCLVDDLVEELHQAIFQRSSFNECVLYASLCELYSCQDKGQIDCETLAHIVSCSKCLDAVSTILGLDLPAMRNPASELNRWASAKDDAISQKAILKRAPVIYRKNQSFAQLSSGD